MSETTVGPLLSKVEFLKKVELFNSFPEKTLSRLAKDCPEIHLANEEELCKEGETGKKMWVILSGELMVYKLKKTITVLNPGDFLGEMALIDNQPRAASVRAIGDASLLEIDETIFKNVILADPQGAISVMRVLTARTRHNLDTIAYECQQLHCLVHDMRNYLVPLAMSEIHMTDILSRLDGTEGGHIRRKGFDELNAGLVKMIMVRNNVLTLIDQTLSIGIRKKSEYVKISTDLVELTQETAEETAFHKQLRNKKLKTVISENSIPKADFNELDIKRVLQNLIINAGYASEKNGLIEVGIKSQKKALQVYVTDHGTGIPDDVKPLLLKEKYTSKPDGNGFGLLSCREIIEDYHQGEFWFESEWGKGTTFNFTIPI